MRTSNYNIFINSDRGGIVFNALTDSYVFVNDDEAKSLKNKSLYHQVFLNQKELNDLKMLASLSMMILMNLLI